MSGGTDMWPWVALWIFLGCVVVVSAGIAIARTVGWHKAEQPQIAPPESTGTQRAWDALRLRYAKGEISREEYLQGKVELEDLLQAAAPRQSSMRASCLLISLGLVSPTTFCRNGVWSKNRSRTGRSNSGVWWKTLPSIQAICTCRAVCGLRGSS